MFIVQTVNKKGFPVKEKKKQRTVSYLFSNKRAYVNL